MSVAGRPARRASDRSDAVGRAGTRAAESAPIEESSEAILEAVVPVPPSKGRAKGLIRSGAIVALAVAISNLLNVVFQLITARLLQPAEYSLLVALLSIILIANVPILALQARVARDVARALEGGREREAGGILIESLRPVGRWGAVVLVVGAVVAVPVAILVNVERQLPVVAVVAVIIVTLPLPITFGGLQGSQQFTLLGISQVVYASVKLIVGIGLAIAGFGASAIVFGLAGATMVTVLASLYCLRGLIARGRHTANRRRKLLDSYTLGSAGILAAIVTLTNMDLLVARAFFDADTAGIYAAVSVAARSLLLLPIIATTVLFPRVAVLRDLAAERNHLLAGLVAVAALGVVILLFFFLIPGPLIELGFGSDYIPGEGWLGPLGAAMLIYALVEVYCFHFLAVGRLRYGLVLGGGVILQLALFAFFHSNPTEIIAVQVVVAVLLLAASEAFDHGHPEGSD
ncbi:MAG: lipopolysaccharide biosynthesis protein [Solirubrobacterales bacterium]